MWMEGGWKRSCQDGREEKIMVGVKWKTGMSWTRVRARIGLEWVCGKGDQCDLPYITRSSGCLFILRACDAHEFLP
jgi:hypothetical protein